MSFILTDHAKQRLEERNIPHPEKLYLKPSNRKYRRLIRERCALNGYKHDLIYFHSDHYHNSINHPKDLVHVFVCSIEGIGIYKVITAFNLKTK